MRKSGLSLILAWSLLCTMLLPSQVRASQVHTLTSDFLEYSIGDREEKEEIKQYSAEQVGGIKENTAESTKEKNDKEKVRVIIEMDSESVLDKVLESGQEYKEIEEEVLEEMKEAVSETKKDLLRYLNETMDIEDKDIQVYDTVLNGVSLEMEAGDMEKLEQISGIKNIYISQEFQRPFVKSASSMIGSTYAHEDLHYKGEGRVVAIIDTGIDTRHRALRLDDVNRARWQKEAMASKIGELQLKGRFYTDKVPYGYNYYDHNDNLLDSYGSMHGMHVAGIVAANDNEKGLYGVAPNAQILAMKVFSDDLAYPTTFTDVWLKALDDAIDLNADIINMSLGSPAGFSTEGKHFPEVEMIEKAKQAGILITIAVGNEGSITDGNSYGVKALAGNYDTGLVANPALDDASLAVASMDNEKKRVCVIEWDNGDTRVQEEIGIYKASTSPDIIKGTYIDLKNGDETVFQRFKNKIQNSIVLLEFPQKIGNEYIDILEKIAKEKPSTIILYNDEKREDKIRSNIDAKEILSGVTIVHIKNATYKKMMEDAMKVFQQELYIHTVPKEVDNIGGGRISKFSTWGPTPDLRIKPEITAVGGSVYSTIENQAFKNMSGTSMASPQVAGAGALVKQYLTERKVEVEHEGDFIKNILMNTAVPIKDEETHTPYPVRRQGSGALNIQGALNAEVAVYATGGRDDSKDAKLELGQLQEKRFDVRLYFENFSENDKTYYIYTDAVYEPVRDGYRSGISEDLYSMQDEDVIEITIPAKSSITKNLHLDYTDAEDLEYNNYLEGFIYLNDADAKANLSIPFLGFYGDWNAQRAIDAFNIVEYGDSQKKEVQFYVNKDRNIHSSVFITKRMLALPIINDTIYFSPLGAYHTEAMIRIAALRNMEEMEYSILDGETQEVLRVIGTSDYVRKLYKLGIKNSFNMMPDSIWDGYIDGNLAKENKEYIYQIKAKLNFKGDNNEQIYRYRIRLDNTNPEFIGEAALTSIDTQMKTAKCKVKDAGSGIEHIYLESVKYVEESGAPLGEGDIPGFDNSPPKMKDIIEDLPKPFETSTEKSEKSDVTTKKPKYGKYIKITLVDEEERNGEKLLKIEDGKLDIPFSVVPHTPVDSKEIFVYRNGYRNQEIEVSIPFFADSSHICISAKDYLSHTERIYLETGANKEYHVLNFMDFYTVLKKANAKVSVNGQELGESVFAFPEKEAKIKIVLPNEDNHLATIGIKKSKNIEYFIRDDAWQRDLLSKYKVSYNENTHTLEFTISDMNANLEIFTAVKPGAMPKIKETKDIRLDLSRIELSDFKSIKIDNQLIDTSSPILNIASGTLKMEMVFREYDLRKVKDVKVRDSLGERILRKYPYFDLIGGLRGYSAGGYSVNIYIDIDEDTEIEVIYDIPKATQSNATFTVHTDSDATVLLHTDSDADIENDIPNSTYPTVFITSPGLLDILSIFNTKDDVVRVHGFIGNMDVDDEVEEFKIYLVDNYGNPISDVYEVKDFEVKLIDYKGSSKSVYKGMGYFYFTDVKLLTFNTNIKAELLTKKGKTASIVRRLFYDKEKPDMEYRVRERDLSSDKAVLDIKASDNSIKLKLYKGDSLMEHINHESISFEKAGVELEKSISIPLDYGQNKIEIKAVDFAGYTKEETIYIYRTRP